MDLFYKRQLTKLTDRHEIAVVLIELDHERKRIKLKANKLRTKKIRPLTIKMDLEFLERSLNKLNILRGQYLIKITRLKKQEKINNRLSTNNVYAETFLQIASGVLNKQTFNKIQAAALKQLGDNSLVTKKPDQTEYQSPRSGNTRTLSLPTQVRKLKK